MAINLKHSSIRLGFFLERTAVTCFSWPNIPYLGIDRLPYLLTDEEEEQLRASGRGELAEIWNHYWDASISGELNVNFELARDLQRQFDLWGVQLEIVYGEIVRIPTNLDQYAHGELWSENLEEALVHRREIHDRLGSRPANIDLLGFDISHPVPTFHSAIFQPGLNESYPSLSEYLNKNGLFETLDKASGFLPATNNLDYGLLPFCILSIWRTPPS